jgi:hypothetical protein
VTTSTGGNSRAGIAGSTSLRGPAQETGEARDENIGSVNMVTSPLSIKKLAWPTHTA